MIVLQTILRQIVRRALSEMALKENNTSENIEYAQVRLQASLALGIGFAFQQYATNWSQCLCTLPMSDLQALAVPMRSCGTRKAQAYC